MILGCHAASDTSNDGAKRHVPRDRQDIPTYATRLILPHFYFIDKTAVWTNNVYIILLRDLHVDGSIFNMESDRPAPVSSASQGTTTGSSQSPEGDYAFLVHSQDSVSHKTPPNPENQHLGRQKRRRTRY